MRRLRFLRRIRVRRNWSLRQHDQRLLLVAGSDTSYTNTSLTLKHATVKAAPGFGIDTANKCVFAADSLIVEANAGGGVRFDQTDFTLTNALVTGNGSASSAYGGLTITTVGEPGKMLLANLTIVGNSATTSAAYPSGLYCSNTITQLINTVIVGNSGGTSESDIAQCTAAGVSHNAYVGAAGSSMISAAARWLNCSPTRLTLTTYRRPAARRAIWSIEVLRVAHPTTTCSVQRGRRLPAAPSTSAPTSYINAAAYLASCAPMSHAVPGGFGRVVRSTSWLLFGVMMLGIRSMQHA